MSGARSTRALNDLDELDGIFNKNGFMALQF